MSDTLPAGADYARRNASVEFDGVTLVDCRYASSLRTPRHAHARPYFGFVLSGSYRESYGAHALDVAAGAVAFHPAEARHVTTLSAAGLHVFRIELDPSRLTRLLGRTLPDAPAILAPDSASIARRMRDELRRRDALSPLVIDALSVELAASLVRTPRDPIAPRWLARAYERLRDDFARGATLSALAPTRASTARISPASSARASAVRRASCCGSCASSTRSRCSRRRTCRSRRSRSPPASRPRATSPRRSAPMPESHRPHSGATRATKRNRGARRARVRGVNVLRMKRLLALSLVLVACHVYAKSERYVIYVHGKAVEEGGRRPSTEFGVYEYDAILKAFRDGGFIVSSEQRPKGADVNVYAKRVADEVRTLLRRGVPPSHITVIGASKGAIITMRASTLLQNPDVRYVLLGDCNDWVYKNYDIRLSGHVLSIYDAGDDFGVSCAPFFRRAGALREHDELELRLGLRHGFLYAPRREWIDPAARWARGGKR